MAKTRAEVTTDLIDAANGVPVKKATATAKKKKNIPAPKFQTKKNVARKSAPKAAAKKATKSGPKTAVKKPAAPAKECGLRKPQVRILRALADNGGWMDRKTIAQKAPVDVATCVEYIGSHDDAKRKKNDEKHFPSLISLGYLTAEQHDVNGRDRIVYSVTAEGRKALQAIGD